MAPTPQWVKDLKPSGPQGHELLKQERAKSNIGVEQLSRFLFTKEGLERKHRILKILENEKAFDKSPNYFAGRVDRFEIALARAKRLRQLAVQHDWSIDDVHAATELISEPGPYNLHEGMFLVRLISYPSLQIVKLTLIRSLCVTKAHQSNARGSTSLPLTTKLLDVMLRLSWDMAPTCEGWRQPQHGTRKTKRLPCTLRI